MQIKLKELLENMTGDGGEPAAEPPGGGVVEDTVEDGPSVATACPPTPRRSNSSIQAAIDAATIDAEADAQADFFNPPADKPRATVELDAADVEEQEVVSHRPQRRTTPPPPPPRRDESEEEAAAAAVADQPTAPAARASSSGTQDAVPGDEEYEAQTFSPGMLSPLSRRPSGVVESVKPPRRDSGLIDVRSMAAAYREYDGLAKKNKESRGADVETVPLPILGAGEHTSPILLPQPAAPSGTNKWLYVLVAVLGAIVVIGSTVAVTALILKRRDGGARSFAALSPSERAALCEAEEEAARIREDEERERIAAARRAPAPVPGAMTDSDEVTAADVAGTTPAPAPIPAATSSSSKPDDDDDRRHRRRGEEDEDRGATSASPATTASSSSSPATSSSTPAPTPPPSRPAATDDLAAAAGSATSGAAPDEKCDEVTCLVSGKGCCGKNAKGAGADKGDEPAPDPSLPARPERSDITAGIASVQGRLQSCGDRFSVRGAVTVKISIAPSGAVKSASTSQGSADFQSCIAGAIKGAKFPATQQGAKVSYPVVLK